jgi:hypothetical protein
MESAGGTPENIAHVKVFLKNEKYRDNVNPPPGSKCFPMNTTALRAMR